MGRLEERSARIRVRKQKAELLKILRNSGKPNSLAVKVANNVIGKLERVEPISLSIYMPYKPIVIDGKLVGLFANKGDCEYWRATWLLDGNWDDEEIAYTFNIGSYYRGPGLGFANEPFIERNGHSTLINQTGGLDI